MDDPVQQLDQLAAGAIAHAQFAHGVALSDGEFETADRILIAERGAATHEHSTVSACYGAWFGNWAIRTLGAAWAGLDEPAAPRLAVHGTVCSPIDAVTRYLADPQSVHGLAWMANQTRSWVTPPSAIEPPQVHNAAAWDQLAGDIRFSGEMPLPNHPEAAIAALDPWLREDWKPGCRLLCLAAGGGRQGPLHAIAGARVTVVDVSQRQLEQDRLVSQRLGLSLSLVQCSADRLVGIPSQAFDVVVQPVSGCYLPDLRSLYAEIARVLRPGGVYLVQHKQPISMQLCSDPNGGYRLDEPAVQHRCLPILASHQAVATNHHAAGNIGAGNIAAGNIGADKGAANNREPGTMEYAHSLQDLIGELCLAGFLIEQFSEPPRADAFAPPGSAAHQACFAPPYFKLKAIRKS